MSQAEGPRRLILRWTSACGLFLRECPWDQCLWEGVGVTEAIRRGSQAVVKAQGQPWLSHKELWCSNGPLDLQ